MNQDSSDKTERRDRYYRRRGSGSRDAIDEPEFKRRTPYRRERIEHDDDFDDWFDEDNS